MLYVFLISLLGLAYAQLANVNKAIGHLSVRLLQSEVKNGENTIHSAYSIASALGMCLLGAKGATYTSMQNAMGFSGMKHDHIVEGYKKSTSLLMLAKANENPGFVINKANRIYINKTFRLGKTYRDQVKNVFKADIERVNFIDDVAVQQIINEFVRNETRGVIPKILSSPLNKRTNMALVNALYFKGSWRKAMDNSTSSKVFNSDYCSSSGRSAQATKWIHVKTRLNYTNSTELKATLVELPYKDNSKSSDKTSMIILLPFIKYNCDSAKWLKSVVTWEKIVSAINSMTPHNVHVTIPRMEIESDFELTEVLRSLGMTEALSRSANFDGMSETGKADVKIDSVIHKAKLQTDEKGTEATAATITPMFVSSAIVKDSDIIEMFIDRPFAAFVVLRQQSSIAPLFSAVVNQV